jgi:hypothetical protein
VTYFDIFARRDRGIAGNLAEDKKYSQTYRMLPSPAI